MNSEFFMTKKGIITRGGWEYKHYDDVFTSEILEEIKEHPEAEEALTIFFKKSIPNKRHFEYLITHQFLCCRFGDYNHETEDIDEQGYFHKEHVTCAIRANCPMGRKVCTAERTKVLTKSQKEVVQMLYNGLSKDEIADVRCVERCTIDKIIYLAMKKTGVHSVRELLTTIIKLGGVIK